MAHFTENGFEIDGISEIREKLRLKANTVFENILNGEDLSTDDSSVLGRIFGIVAESKFEDEQLLEDFITTFNPDNASGTMLDDFLYLSGMQRMDSTPASALLMLTGVNGSTIGNISVKSSVTGDIFNINSTTIFDPSDCNGVEFFVEADNTIKTYSFQYSVVGKPSENPPISVLSTESDTNKSLAQRIAQTINNQTSDLSASVTNDNLVNVFIINRYSTGFFVPESNMTIQNVIVSKQSVSATYSAISQLPNSLNSVASGANINLKSVTNPYLTYASVSVESDEKAKVRWFNAKAQNGYGEYDHLQTALTMVDGVKFVNIQTNITSSSSGERVNQGVAIVVDGGDDQEIAQAIFNNIAVGTATNGLVESVASDILGVGHIVKFSRPVYVPIRVSMSLKALPNFPTNGKNIIKQSIVDWFNELQVGEDILYSRLFNPINRVDGFSVNNLKIGRVGGNFGVNDVTLKYNELATIKADDILIGGS